MSRDRTVWMIWAASRWWIAFLHLCLLIRGHVTERGMRVCWHGGYMIPHRHSLKREWRAGRGRSRENVFSTLEEAMDWMSKSFSRCECLQDSKRSIAHCFSCCLSLPGFGTVGQAVWAVLYLKPESTLPPWVSFIGDHGEKSPSHEVSDRLRRLPRLLLEKCEDENESQNSHAQSRNHCICHDYYVAFSSGLYLVYQPVMYWRNMAQTFELSTVKEMSS